MRNTRQYEVQVVFTVETTSEEKANGVVDAAVDLALSLGDFKEIQMATFAKVIDTVEINQRNDT